MIKNHNQERSAARTSHLFRQAGRHRIGRARLLIYRTDYRCSHGMLPDIVAVIARKYHEHSRRVCQAGLAPSCPGRRTPQSPATLLRGDGAFSCLPIVVVIVWRGWLFSRGCSWRPLPVPKSAAPHCEPPLSWKKRGTQGSQPHALRRPLRRPKSGAVKSESSEDDRLSMIIRAL